MGNDPVWASVTSHRGRDQLRRAVGTLSDSYGRWADHGPTGEYYQIDPPVNMEEINRIKGVRVLRNAPKDLFRRWGQRERTTP